MLDQLASVGEMRAGSLTARFRRCGKSGCHCARPDDPGHGPVLSLTRHENGKTVTRIIPAHAEAETRGFGPFSVREMAGCITCPGPRDQGYLTHHRIGGVDPRGATTS